MRKLKYIFLSSLAVLLLGISSRCAYSASGILFVVDDVVEKNIYLLQPGTGALKKITQKPKDVRFFLNLDPAVSPDGRLVAYTSFAIYPDEHLKLWSERIGGWNGKPLFSEELFTYGYDYFPTRIWRRSLRSFNWNIFVQELNTGKTRQYTQWKWDEVRPEFMKRGSDVLYALAAEKSVFILQGKPSGKFKQITVQDNEALFPRLSPDGRKIVFQSFVDGNWELFDLILAEKVKDKLKTRLTHTTNVSEVLPRWSPDGKRIVFLANGGDRRFYDLYMMDRADMKVTPLTRNGRCSGEAAWSPDGKKIAFSGASGADNVISVVDVTSKKVTTVVKGRGMSRFPAWSPNGKRIAFISNIEGKPRLYIANYPNVTIKKATNKLLFWNQPVWF